MDIKPQGTPSTPQNYGDGAYGYLRLVRTGALAVARIHALGQEAAIRGKLFWGSNQTAGVAPGTSLGTSAALAIYNPSGSGVAIVIWKLKLFLGSTPGTIGAGVIFGVDHSSQGTPGGTAITPKPCLVGSGLSPAAAKVFESATSLSAVSGTPTHTRPLWTIGALAAQATGSLVEDEIVTDGDIVVAPNSAFSIQEVGASGSTPKLGYAIQFEEVPYP